MAVESPWLAAKALATLVEAAVLHKKPGLGHELEAALKKHKSSFTSPLKNPVM